MGKWILDQAAENGMELEEDELEVFVLFYTRFFNYLAINEDGSCEIRLDVRHLFEGVDAFRSPCRIDGNRLNLLDSGSGSIGESWATLNLRVDGASLVLWCSLEYYLDEIVEIDLEETTNQTILEKVRAFRALFEGPNRYENHFEKVSDTPSAPPSPEGETPVIPESPPSSPPPAPPGTG